MNIRRGAFWYLDAVKGGNVRKSYLDIAFHFSSGSTLLMASTNKERLTNLLNHSVKSTRFYSNYDSKDFNSFPVVNKNIIRENETDFISNSFKREELVAMTTSGSTGTPFTVYHNAQKRARNSADAIFFGEYGGYKLGNKLAFLKIWSEINKKSNLTRWKENMVCIDVLNLESEASNVTAQLNMLNTPMNFIGYVSAFETLANHLSNYKNEKLQFESLGIITISEALSHESRIQISKEFNCPVVSRYSNIENGVIAQQPIEGESYFRINTASYFVEIMDIQEDRVLPLGETGRIIVTDYFNYGMPLIRYDTGDIGCIETREIMGVQVDVLGKIEGRKLDRIFNTKGELISSYIVYRNMFAYTEIDQYQFIQKSAFRYVIKISCKEGFKREVRLVSEFKAMLGEGAEVSVEYVNEIPLLSSGKRKKVVNELLS